MDDADKVTRDENVYIEAAIHNWNANISRINTTNNLNYCIDCGEPIPQARKEAVPGCTRCVLCQRAIEERGNL